MGYACSSCSPNAAKAFLAAGRQSSIGEPTSTIVLSVSRWFPKDQLGAYMSKYYGFERMDASNSHAIFTDSLTASMALEDLLVSTNFGVHFKELQVNVVPSDESRASASISVFGVPSSAEIAGADENERAGWENRLAWGNTGIIAGLFNFFTRFKGFRKLSFLPNSIAAVDFDDTENGKRALARVNQTTKLEAEFAQFRGTDQSHLPLEPPSVHVFLRLDPPGLDLEDARGFFGCKGHLVRIAKTSVRFAKATFISVERATEAVELCRSHTNLSVNFFRGYDRPAGVEIDDRRRAKIDRPIVKRTSMLMNGTSSLSAGGSSGTSTAAPAPVGSSPEPTWRRANQAIQPNTHVAVGPVKEWPGVRLSSMPTGSSVLLNPLELFRREPGFLRILLEADGACVGLFESEGEALGALSRLTRLLVRPPSAAGGSEAESCFASVTRAMPRESKGGNGDPTDIVSVRLGGGVDVKLVEALLVGFDGFQHVHSGTSGESFAQFSSISKAKKALEELRTNTNLQVEFSETLGSVSVAKSIASARLNTRRNSLNGPSDRPANSSNRIGHQTEWASSGGPRSFEPGFKAERNPAAQGRFQNHSPEAEGTPVQWQSPSQRSGPDGYRRNDRGERGGFRGGHYANGGGGGGGSYKPFHDHAKRHHSVSSFRNVRQDEDLTSGSLQENDWASGSRPQGEDGASGSPAGVNDSSADHQQPKKGDNRSAPAAARGNTEIATTGRRTATPEDPYRPKQKSADEPPETDPKNDTSEDAAGENSNPKVTSQQFGGRGRGGRGSFSKRGGFRGGGRGASAAGGSSGSGGNGAASGGGGGSVSGEPVG
ncbi:hypothetical protein DFJ73DRAFT_839730 [Zopfochytrium polystomum]|nr:hypothetical protein DFJ73DRAFT_839730 [Zopfochytrium polystomum]